MTVLLPSRLDPTLIRRLGLHRPLAHCAISIAGTGAAFAGLRSRRCGPDACAGHARGPGRRVDRGLQPSRPQSPPTSATPSSSTAEAPGRALQGRTCGRTRGARRIAGATGKQADPTEDVPSTSSARSSRWRRTRPRRRRSRCREPAHAVRRVASCARKPRSSWPRSHRSARSNCSSRSSPRSRARRCRTRSSLKAWIIACDKTGRSPVPELCDVAMNLFQPGYPRALAVRELAAARSAR